MPAAERVSNLMRTDKSRAAQNENVQSFSCLFGWTCSKGQLHPRGQTQKCGSEKLKKISAGRAHRSSLVAGILCTILLKASLFYNRLTRAAHLDVASGSHVLRDLVGSIEVG